MGVAGATAQNPMFQMLEMQNQMLTMMIGLLMNLMQAQGQKMESALSGSGGDMSAGGGSSAVGGGGGGGGAGAGRGLSRRISCSTAEESQF